MAFAAALVISMNESLRLPTTSSSKRWSSAADVAARGLVQRVEHVDHLASALEVHHSLPVRGSG